MRRQIIVEELSLELIYIKGSKNIVAYAHYSLIKSIITIILIQIQ